MQVLEKNRQEVQAKADRMSDFLKMEYLENVIKKLNDIDVLRYSYLELSRLYEGRKMYPEAVKYIAKFQEICISSREKAIAFTKEAEILIHGGFYERASMAFKRASELSSELEKRELKNKIAGLLKSEADKAERANRPGAALKAYENLINYVSDAEKPEVKARVLILYKKLGKVRESLELEREMQRKI
ncbi:MAG: hypothetical protein ACP5OG_00510 [Candidatus Nanoarchaeia archaeon]